MALRMKCTRQRCQVASSTLLIAAFSPSWASDTTSLTPRRPRLCRLPQELCPEWFGLGVANGHAEHLAPAVGVDGNSDDHRHGYYMMITAGLDVGGIEPKIRPITRDRAGAGGPQHARRPH